MKMNAILKSIFAIYVLLLIGCGKKNSGTASSNLPSVNIGNISQLRSTSSAVFHFPVTLSTASTTDVSVHYATVSGTATPNKDFSPINGTITIPANSLSGSIDVTVIGDSLRQADQSFSVQLDNPTNCTLGTSVGVGTIINSDGLYFPVDTTGYSTPTSYPGYTLAWSDEFNGNQIDPNTWTFESGNNNGWGNNELEFYTSSTQNAFVSNGNLIIEARQQASGGFPYSSARIKTQDKKTFTYGRIDIRAKLPTGQGIWPALWMLGNNISTVSWPACGEIDIMELLGQQPNKVYQTIHWGADVATNKSIGTNYVLNSGNFNQQFHVYSLDWEQDSIKMFVDDQTAFAVPRTSVNVLYPFDSPFFFVFNIACGGNWPGSPDGTTVFPQRMVVDYVRVFQH